MILSNDDIEYLNDAKKLIDNDISLHHTIIEIARHVGLSETRLTRGFKLLYKMGLFEYLENSRLEKGKYLLENSNKRLKQISTSLGYRYCNNFNTAFRKKYGKPPGKWKKDFKNT